MIEKENIENYDDDTMQMMIFEIPVHSEVRKRDPMESLFSEILPIDNNTNKSITV